MAREVPLDVQPRGYETSFETVPTRTYTLDTLVGHTGQHGQVEQHVPLTATTVLTNQDPVKLSNGFARPSLAPTRLLRASEIETCSTAPEELSEHTQRRLLGATQATSQNPLLTLAHPRYGLPSRLTQNLSSMGINSIYSWQSACLPRQRHPRRTDKPCLLRSNRGREVPGGRCANAQANIVTLSEESNPGFAICGSSTRKTSMASSCGRWHYRVLVF